MINENKVSFRYRTSGILIFLILVSLLSFIPNFLLDMGSTFETNYMHNVTKDFIYDIDNTLYQSNMDRYYSVNDVLKDSFFNYYIKSSKIKNYPMTSQYKELHPSNIVGVTRSGEYVYYGSLDEAKSSQSYDGVVRINAISPEEPIYGENYLTNDEAFQRKYGKDYQFSIDRMDFKEGYTVITGKWDTLGLTINEPTTYEEDGEKAFVLNALVTSIKEIYNRITPEDTGISELDFAYIIDLNSPELAIMISNSKFYSSFVPKTIIYIILAALVFVILGVVTNFYKAKEVGFYKSIEKFPIEIVLILTGLWFLPVLVGFSPVMTGLGTGYVNELSTVLTGIAAVQVILVFFSGIAILYFVYGIKSIYNEGFKSFVFNNSITKKVVSIPFRFTKNEIGELTNNFEGTNKIVVIGSYVGLLLLGYFGTRIFVNYGGRNIVFVLWAILITGIYIYFKKYLDSILEIESVAKLIAEGNYNVNIDESSTRFKTLAHSLNTVSANLDNAVEDALKSERMKTELITNVSHDLKTPLTSIINYSELIVESDASEDEIKEYAGVINEKSHRLKSLIESLFEVSKLSSNNVELHLEELDFVQLVEQTIGEWEDKLSEKSLDININLPDEPIIIDLDGVQTSRILENVFSNIHKYAQENTRVYVDLLKKDKVELVIKNISKYSLNISADELMERFTRGDASRNTEGSGLGLSIAKSLTEIQGGEFKINIDGDLFKITIEF